MDFLFCDQAHFYNKYVKINPYENQFIFTLQTS